MPMNKKGWQVFLEKGAWDLKLDQDEHVSEDCGLAHGHDRHPQHDLSWVSDKKKGQYLEIFHLS